MKKFELMPILLALKTLIEKDSKKEAIELIDRVLSIDDEPEEES